MLQLLNEVMRRVRSETRLRQKIIGQAGPQYVTPFAFQVELLLKDDFGFEVIKNSNKLRRRGFVMKWKG